LIRILGDREIHVHKNSPLPFAIDLCVIKKGWACLNADVRGKVEDKASASRCKVKKRKISAERFMIE
jgi:hypothetical protein